MIDLNRELSISDAERSELILHLFNDMNDLKTQGNLRSLPSSDIYNHFIDKKDLPAWIRQRIHEDLTFTAKLHELIIRYKEDFDHYSY